MIWLGKKRGFFQDWLSQKLAKWTGKRIDPANASWLIGPVGETNIIDDQYISQLIKNENLYRIENKSGFGLMDSMEESLKLTSDEKNRLLPQIKDFYEHTYNYQFEVWSKWTTLFQPFGWLIKIIFSKRLRQLNLPLNSIDLSEGVNSNIIKLKDKQTDNTKYTIWYRIINKTSEVIYSGIYDHVHLPSIDEEAMKIIFPLPNGNGSVIMKKTILEDGSFKIESSGKKFGEPGFYFYLTDHNQKHWGNHIKSLHEYIHVYVDKTNTLRTDHVLKLHGWIFMTLHYKILKKP